MPVLSQEDAITIKRLEDAAKEHGVVMDLLNAIERWQSSGRVVGEDMQLFELASMTAPLARIARLNEGIDTE